MFITVMGAPTYKICDGARGPTKASVEHRSGLDRRSHRIDSTSAQIPKATSTAALSPLHCVTGLVSARRTQSSGAPRRRDVVAVCFRARSVIVPSLEQPRSCCGTPRSMAAFS